MSAKHLIMFFLGGIALGSPITANPANSGTVQDKRLNRSSLTAQNSSASTQDSRELPPLPPRTSSDIIFLEKIVNKLFDTIYSENASYIGRTNIKINEVQPKPKNYNGHYKSKEEFKLAVQQLEESFNNVKQKALKQIGEAKKSTNKTDLMKLFENIFLDVYLVLIKNFKQHILDINSELTQQWGAIIAFNKQANEQPAKKKNWFARNMLGKK